MLPARQPSRRRLDRLADLAAFACLLALPLALLHARAVAEMLIAAIGLLFLLHVALTRQEAWLLAPFAIASSAWWLWLSVCSAIGSGGVLLGLLAIRLPLLAVAAGTWCLAGPDGARRQHLLWLVLAASLAWVGLECWQQYLTGSNLFGQPRWGDGALTGPFNRPRAGPAFILLLFPVLLPAVLSLWQGGRRRRLAALALAVLGVATQLLIGQRMPAVLMLVGLAASALILPVLRPAILAALAAGCTLLAGLPWLSPEANTKLVLHFGEQMRHFGESPYGLIFVRAYAVAEQHPWTGLGFDGFRRGCTDIWNMHGINWLHIPTDQLNGGFAACNLHPHNYYLEAADNAGLPGLALFTLMAATALFCIGRGLRRRPEPVQAGLFAATLLAFWPVASTSAFTSMPNGGWVFLLVGAGLAREAGNAGALTPFAPAARSTDTT